MATAFFAARSRVAGKVEEVMRRLGTGYVKRAILGLVLVVAAALAVIRFAPFYLSALPDAAPVVGAGPHAIFGYATLANPAVRFVIIGAPAPSRAGLLEGYRRAGRDLVLDPGSAVAGRIFIVDARGLERLDRYEQTGLRYDRRIEELADGTAAWVYRLIE